MPYKTWAPFERLLSDDMNTYLSEQVAAIFPSASARDTAIPSPITGQPAYLTDIHRLTVWSGSAWLTVGGRVPVAQLEGTGTQTIGSAVNQKISLPTVVEDTHGFALGSDQLTIPAGLAGVYEISASLHISATSTGVGYRDCQIAVNGTMRLRELRPPMANTSSVLTLSGITRLAVADVISLIGAHTQGANLTSVKDTTAPRLSIVRIGD
jgi:hypothetical protein